MAKLTLHKQTLANMNEICAWFSAKTASLSYPIYSSYDIRDSGYKVTNVDANIFPQDLIIFVQRIRKLQLA